MKIKVKTALSTCIFLMSSTAAVAQNNNDNLEDAWDIDAAQYAQDYAIDVNEAKKRLKAQSEIGDLNNILTLSEAQNFGGLYIEHQPYRINVLFKDVKQAGKFRQRFNAAPWLSSVKFRQVKNSLKELKAAQLNVRKLVGKLSVKVDSDINIAKNQVELYVKDQYSFEQALALSQQKSMSKTGAALSKNYSEPALFTFNNTAANNPVNVSLVEVRQLAKNEADIYGGLGLRTCTSGFSVKNASGTKGILTSAHCNNSQTYSGKSLPFQSEIYTAACDVQWHTAPDFSVTNEFRSSSSGFKRKVTGTVSRNSQTVGGYVCKYGKTTGYKCGYITSKNYLSTSQPNSTATFIRVSKDGVDLSSGGDSGGPWFLGNNAYGIHKCGIGNDSCYMAINYASELGVSVLTK